MLAKLSANFVDDARSKLNKLQVGRASDWRRGMLRERSIGAVLEKNLSADDRALVLTVARQNSDLLFSYKLLLDCCTTIEWMLIADSLVPGAAWNSSPYGRGDQLDFVWHAFLNATYNFRGMVKSSFNHTDALSKRLVVQRPSKDELRLSLRKIDQHVGELIAWRGTNAHEYLKPNKWISGIEALEMLRKSGDAPKRPGHVNFSQNVLRRDMRSAVVDCLSALESHFQVLLPVLACCDVELESIWPHDRFQKSA